MGIKSNSMRILLTGVSTRAMVESALKSLPAGKILSLDYFGDYDLQGLCENYSLKRTFCRPFTASNLFSASQYLSFQAVIYTSNLENYPSLLKKFQRKSILLGNSPETLSRIRNPGIFFPFLERTGIPYPKTYFKDQKGKIKQSDPEFLQSMFLQKPIRSGGGFGITQIRVSEKKARQLIQEYIPGLPCSALFLANGQDSVLIGLTEQLIGLEEFGSRGFRYCGNILGKVWREAEGSHLLGELAEITTLLTREFKLRGANGIDFILKDGVPYLLEVNPRYTAAMELIEKAYHLPIVEAHLNSLEGYLPAFNLTIHLEKGYWGKAILFAEKNLKVPPIQRDWFERGIRDIPREGEFIYKGEPVCTLFACGPTREACYRQLVEKAEKLKADLASFCWIHDSPEKLPSKELPEKYPR